MNHDLTEQRLREQLHAAADGQSGSYVDIDPLTALDSGRRVLRRRRVAAVAGTAAAALAVGVGAWAVLADRAADDRTLPAATPSVSVSVPDPVAELPLGPIPQTGRSQPLVAAVGDDQTGQGLVFSLRTEDGAVVASQRVPTGMTPRPRWTTLIPGVTLAVLPPGSTSAAAAWTGGQTAQGTAAVPMPDGRVLVAWWIDGTSQDRVTDIVSTDGEGVFTSSGSPVSSVLRGDVLFFAGGRDGMIGYLAPGDTEALGTGDIRLAADMPPGTFPAVWLDSRTGPGGTYATYLPPVRDVELVTGDGATVTDLTVHDPEELDGIIVVAQVDGDRESVTEVRFFDPDPNSLSTDGRGPAPAD